MTMHTSDFPILWDLVSVLRFVSSFHLSSSSLKMHVFHDLNVLTETRVFKHHQSINQYIIRYDNDNESVAGVVAS